MNRVLKFYSKSSAKTEPTKMGGTYDWRKHLSNFHLSEVVFHGIAYPSVEHAFAAIKYLYAKRVDPRKPDHPDFAKGWVTDRDHQIVWLVDGALKKAHGRAAMKKYGYELDVDRFNKDKVDIMRQLIASRLELDSTFREILVAIRDGGYYLLHQENRGGGFWGGRIDKTSGELKGENVLGQIMMDLASTL